MALTTHHCPKASQGSCRKAKTPAAIRYCSEHQTYCKVPGCSSKYPHLLTEGCKTCNNKKAHEQKQKDEKKKADDKAKKDKKDREEREKREKVQSRKPEIMNKK